MQLQTETITDSIEPTLESRTFNRGKPKKKRRKKKPETASQAAFRRKPLL